MAKNLREVTQAHVLAANGKYTIVVYEQDNVYTPKVFDERHKRLSITLQLTRDPAKEDEELIVTRVINRTIKKINELYRTEAGHVDYVVLFSNLSDEERDQLCPPEWDKPSTRKAELVFYQKNVVELIQSILNAVDRVAAEEEVRDKILQIVRDNQHQRKAETLTEADEENLDLRAAETADRHILATNRLYDASRSLLLQQYDLPAIHIPRLVLAKAIPVEQGKALPRAMMVQLALLFYDDIPRTSLAVGGILMLCCMLRTAETCPRYGEIVDFGNYGVYGILTQSDGTVRVQWTKSLAGARLIIVPKYAMDAIRERRKVLAAQGLSEEEIDRAYVVSHDDDPFSPVRPAALSAYIRRQMGLLGVKAEYWQSISLLAAREPDLDVYGHALGDLEAYVLRRSGCTFLTNCTTMPDVGAMTGGSPYALVDALMGHKLSGVDNYWREWVSREDNWPLIASLMEGIILDPEHSAHPAFTAGTTTVRGQTQVCHSLQRYIVTAADAERGSVTLQIRCHNSADGAVLRLPHTVQADYKRLHRGQQHVCTYGVQEVLDRDYYAELIQEARTRKETKRNDES